MLALIKPFVGLCLLQTAPQDLPASRILLGLALVAYFLVGVLLGARVYEIGASLQQAAVDLAFLAAYTWGLLAFSGHTARFEQTMTALAGAGTILGLVSLPLASALLAVPEGAETGGMAVLGYLLLVGWLLFVYGHIFRHALSRAMPAGLLASFGYLLLSSMVIQLLFPTAGPPG